MQLEGSFKAELHAQLLSLILTFFFWIRRLHANHHFSEESDQVLTQEDSVICDLTRERDLYKHIPQNKGLFPSQSPSLVSISHQTSAVLPLPWHFGGVG